ncbi:MAG: hypothetical protein QW248_04620 [Candidatus Nitrosocaldus sp.]
MKALIYIVSVYTVLLASIGSAYAQKVFEQGIVITQVGNSYDVTCLSEPAHPAGVNGDITIIADKPYSKPLIFNVGDFNSNGVMDDSATVRFPDDFNTNQRANFTVLCKMWSGYDRDEEGLYNSITAEFWQTIYADSNVMFRQGLIMPESIPPASSIDIVCFSEPTYTTTVNGIIIVKTPDGRTYFKSGEFISGDVDGNGVADNHIVVRFPDDFAGYPPADTNIMGSYTTFCDFTNGTYHPGGGVVLDAGEFWQTFWVSFHVVPESILGTMLLLISSIALLVLRYR